MSKAHDHLVLRLNAARTFIKAPAVLAVIVRKNGRYVNSAVRGVRKNDLSESANGNSVQAGDIFPLASVSKPLSGYMLGVLLKLTRFHWNTTIGDAFPEFNNAFCRRHYRIKDDYLRTTIAQMMSHTARFRYAPANGTYEALKDTWGDFNAQENREFCDSGALRQRRYNYAITAQQDEPGPLNVYNGGPILPAAMMERLTGKSYEQLMQEYLFGPLEMNGAKVGRQSTAAAVPDGVWSHSYDFTKLAFSPNSFFVNPMHDFSSHAPAGNVGCNADDLAKFIRAQFPNSSNPGPLQGTWLQETLNLFANGFSVSGWITSGTGNSLTVSHDGDSGGQRARIVIRPNQGEGYAVCTNGGGEGPIQGKTTNMGLAIVNSVAGEIEEMLKDWTTLFPGE
jgi:CubicO group peptidase (beta-lactamase class C family)